MRPADIDFARLALARGWISPECHDVALREADRVQAMGLPKSVEEILLDGGRLLPRQVRVLRGELGWTLSRPRIGDYEIVRRIGLGGMGNVFEAFHVRLKQRAAVKILLPRYARDITMADRFVREARMLARLNHPNLVHAMDSGKDGEHYYLAMEFVEGEDLRQVLSREGRLDVLSALRIVRAVCSALCALQARGLVHRDVKPANILLSEGGEVKLADLGLLKAVDSCGEDREHFVCGTPHYISPEQALRREDVDGRSDIYSLGATWYHALVGRPPFLGKTTGEVLRAHVERPPQVPAELREAIPPSIERAIARWMAKDRAERPGSAAEALQEVENLFFTARPLGSRASRAAEGLSRAVRRRPLPFLLSIVGLLVTAGTLLVLLRGGGDPPAAGREAEPPLPEAPEVAGEFPPGSPPELQRLPPAGGGDLRPERPTSAVKRPPVRSEGLPPEPSVEIPLPSSAGSGGGLEVPEVAPAERSSVEGLVRWAGHGARRVAASGREAIAVLSERFLERLGDSDHPRALARSFHADIVAVEPRPGAPWTVVLEYSFRDPAELLDFRLPADTLSVEETGLVHDGARPAAAFRTVAWFVPPLSVETELSRDSALIVGFGPLRFSPGSGLDAGSWWRGEEGETPPSAVALTPAGPLSVRIRDRGVEWTMDGTSYRLDVRIPETGRLSLELTPGASLRRLRLEGRLDPTWSEARVSLLERR